MIKFNKQMIEKTPWQQNNAEVLFQWTKHGILMNTRDIKFRKLAFLALAAIIVIPSLFLLTAPNYSSIFQCIIIIFISAVYLIPLGVIAYWGILDYKIHTYRITSMGLESAYWSDQVAIGRVIAQGFIWFILCFLFIFFILDPTSILVSLGGMIGVGLMAGATLFSKQYEEVHLEYHYQHTDWSELTKRVKIDPRRKIIIAWASILYRKEQRFQMYSLFCTHDNFDAVSQLIIQHAERKGLDIVYGEAFTDT